MNGDIFFQDENSLNKGDQGLKSLLDYGSEVGYFLLGSSYEKINNST